VVVFGLFLGFGGGGFGGVGGGGVGVVRDAQRSHALERFSHLLATENNERVGVYQNFRNRAFYALYNHLKFRKPPKREVGKGSKITANSLLVVNSQIVALDCVSGRWDTALHLLIQTSMSRTSRLNGVLRSALWASGELRWTQTTQIGHSKMATDDANRSHI